MNVTKYNVQKHGAASRSFRIPLGKHQEQTVEHPLNITQNRSKIAEQVMKKR